MNVKINPVGKKYGKLLVLEEISAPYENNDKYRKTILKLKCLCECGEIMFPFKGNVIRGKTTQCTYCQNSLIKIGEKKGSLTILSRTYIDGKRKYLCKCDCGFEDTYSSQFLLRNKKKYCKECKLRIFNNKIIKMKSRSESIIITNFNKHLKTKDFLIGKKNGRLKIVSFSHWEQKSNRRRAYYKAKCKCGNEVIVRDCFAQKSCGCLKKDSMPKGEDVTNSSLTNSEAEAIREFKKSSIGYTNREIAKIFKVHETTISRVLLERSYKSIK